MDTPLHSCSSLLTGSPLGCPTVIDSLQGNQCDFLKFLSSCHPCLKSLSGLSIAPQGHVMPQSLAASFSFSLFFKHGKSILLQDLCTCCSLCWECPSPGSSHNYVHLFFQVSAEPPPPQAFPHSSLSQFPVSSLQTTCHPQSFCFFTHCHDYCCFPQGTVGADTISILFATILSAPSSFCLGHCRYAITIESVKGISSIYPLPLGSKNT